MLQLRNKLYSLPIYVICLSLLSPFLLFCFRLKTLALPQDGYQWILVFFATSFQAGAASVFSLALGILGSRGLIAFAKKRYYPWLEGLILLPCLIPSLLLALSFIHLIEKIMNFPFGIFALIVAQTLTYTGLCTVVFTRAILKSAPLLSEWVYLHTPSFFLFLKGLLQTVLFKDLKTLFVLVFAGAFTSLSLPLLVAGSPFLSLEFFIYEHLKDPNLWPQALFLILLQSVFIFFICWKGFAPSQAFDHSWRFQNIYIFPKTFFILIPLSSVFFSLGGLFFISNLQVISQLWSLYPLIVSASFNSLILSLGVGSLTFVTLLLICLSFQNLKARRFIASFTPPGVSFMGFTLLIWPFYSQMAILIKWSLGLSLLLFPLVYRFLGEQVLERLSKQVKTARFLGASWPLISQDILWPQTQSAFFLCAGVASFWACGDFAYSLIVSGSHWTLSLLVYDLFSSYRLEEALILSWFLLILSSFVFSFWIGVAFVFNRKFVIPKESF